MKNSRESIMLVKAIMLNEECKFFEDEDIDDMINDALINYGRNLDRELSRKEVNRLNAGCY